jgi:hypothetical protein
MTVSIRRIHPVCAGEGSGIDLWQPAMQGEAASIRHQSDPRHAPQFGRSDLPTVEHVAAA